jgi:hypothetical protein
MSSEQTALAQPDVNRAGGCLGYLATGETVVIAQGERQAIALVRTADGMPQRATVFLLLHGLRRVLATAYNRA